MKNNKKEIYLIIITTFFSVIIMVFSFSIKQPKSYIDEKIEESEENYLDKDIAFNKNKEESLLSEKDKWSKVLDTLFKSILSIKSSSMKNFLK